MSQPGDKVLFSCKAGALLCVVERVELSLGTGGTEAMYTLGFEVEEAQQWQLLRVPEKYIEASNL